MAVCFGEVFAMIEVVAINIKGFATKARGRRGEKGKAKFTAKSGKKNGATNAKVRVGSSDGGEGDGSVDIKEGG